ncbi:MAG: hypothetical protein DYG96_01305 [Chlorobi bacterium CHB2]|nr:hypothetical protein [Chlorobi bacterium CHB2]
MLLSLAPDQRREAGAALAAGSKQQMLFDFYQQLIAQEQPFEHRQAVAQLYGAHQTPAEFRKAYTALLRLNDSLGKKLNEFGSRQLSAPVAVALSPTELRYYQARALHQHGRWHDAEQLLRHNIAELRTGFHDEFFVAQNHSLYLRILHKIAAPETATLNSRQQDADQLARVVLHGYMNFLRTALHRDLRTKRTEEELAEWQAEIEQLRGLWFLRDHQPMIEYMKLTVEAEYHRLHDDWGTMMEAWNRRVEVFLQLADNRYSFMSDAAITAEQEQGYQAYSTGMKALNEDDLETASDCFAQAMSVMGRTPVQYHRMMTMRIGILFSSHRLQGIPQLIEELICHNRKAGLEYQLASARVYQARYRLYQPELGNHREIMDALLAMERYLEPNSPFIPPLLRIKAKYFYRIGDLDGLEVVASAIKSRSLHDVSVTLNHQCIRLMVLAAQYADSPSQRLARRYCQLRQTVLAIAPGEKFRKNFMAEWLRRFGPKL